MSRRWLQYLSQEGGIEYLAKVAMLELAAPEIRLVRKFGKSASLTADTTGTIASISHEVLLIKGEFNQYTGF